MFYQATHITGIRTITSMYPLMSSKTSLLTVCLILHITGIFSGALSFHVSLCTCVKSILNTVLGLSLLLEYWIPPFQSGKPASYKYIKRTANRMHRCCCQLVFVTEVNLGYVRYFTDFNYCFQFILWHTELD
jgi:hypothetical protein